MSLAQYRKKRNFDTTPEPATGGRRGGAIFVVQLHHASHRHFDFRLELDGVLKSWAVPKGPSFDPSVKRLAVEVEDHPLSYADFEGDIAAGNYGAGHVDIFDAGTWKPIGNARDGLARGDLKFELTGKILRGSWVLVRTRKQAGKQQWLLIKHRDAFASTKDADDFVDPKTDRPLTKPRSARIRSRQQSRPDRAKKPAAAARRKAETIRNAAFSPQLCKLQPSPPDGDGWVHEIKWDGYRILATIVEGAVRLWSRNGIEWTQRLPELAAAIATLGLSSAQLDGEMIVERDGRDSFNALQSRLSAEVKDPLLYMLFDAPHLEGRALRDRPLVERKAALREVLDKHPHELLRYSEHTIGHGKLVFAQAAKAGYEGIVSKRADSPYRGARNGDWVKVKGRPSDEFVVVGYTDPKGSRSDLGALLLGQYREGVLTYVGRVGTGLDDALRTSLRKRLVTLRSDAPPEDTHLIARRDRALAIWVEPKIVVEAYFQGIGGQGLLRQPAFKALRSDKTIDDLMPESTAKSGKAKPRRAGAKAAPATRSKASTLEITHADRVVYPQLGATKGDVAEYYRSVAPWLLAGAANRPLSVVRCPGGAAKACFFQKHLAQGWGEHIQGVAIEEDAGSRDYLSIADDEGLLELVQMNVLEIHPWGSRSTDPEQADRIVFDLDPHASITWPQMTRAARRLRDYLQSLQLESFVRTSGGKGLHVVVSLRPTPWAQVKAFARAVAETMASRHATEFVSVAGEKKRSKRIFIDWLRNAHGATSVASYSLRARPSAGVAMPLAWEEIGRARSGDAFTIRNALKKIRARASDPWAGIDKLAQRLPRAGK